MRNSAPQSVSERQVAQGSARPRESGLADVVDPLGGSYYVEAMTNAIEAEAKEYIRKIDEMGGAVEAIDKGEI